MRVRSITQKLVKRFSQNSVKMLPNVGLRARKKPLDFFYGNPDHVTLGLGLDEARTTLHVGGYVFV